MSIRLSKSIEQEVIRMYTTPATDGTWTGNVTIARTLGIAHGTVTNILKRHGVPTRNTREAYANGKRSKPITHLPPEGEKTPKCKCGCGLSVAWNQRKNRWNAYVVGHYRKDRPYKHEDWLREQYETNHRSVYDIADECGVDRSAIQNFMEKFGIKARTTSETLLLNGSMSGPKNPAWKGGVSEWEYPSGWKRIAASIRKRDNYTCQICFTQFSKTSKLLHVHHKDEDKMNCDPDNLVSVCATCHPKGKRGVWVPRKQPERQYVISRRGQVFGFDPAEWLSVKKAAGLIAVHTSHIIDLGKLNRFHIEKKGGFWYVERASFEAFAKTYKRGSRIH